jgi:hypothetical protein
MYKAMVEFSIYRRSMSFGLCVVPFNVMSISPNTLIVSIFAKDGNCSTIGGFSMMMVFFSEGG